MIFQETPIAGAWVVEPERLGDDRGFFARTVCEHEFAEQGIDISFVQSSISFNADSGTLRGMHYHESPHEERKLVRCTRGEMYDVCIDLRPTSSTFKQHYGVILSQENRSAFYLPKGVAHGFITLAENTEVLYQMGEFFQAGHERGVRYNDPVFDIKWPAEVRNISARDAGYPDYEG